MKKDSIFKKKSIAISYFIEKTEATYFPGALECTTLCAINNFGLFYAWAWLVCMVRG